MQRTNASISFQTRCGKSWKSQSDFHFPPATATTLRLHHQSVAAGPCTRAAGAPLIRTVPGSPRRHNSISKLDGLFYRVVHGWRIVLFRQFPLCPIGIGPFLDIDIDVRPDIGPLFRCPGETIPDRVNLRSRPYNCAARSGTSSFR
jgi:hypothetical protein